MEPGRDDSASRAGTQTDLFMSKRPGMASIGFLYTFKHGAEDDEQKCMQHAATKQLNVADCDGAALRCSYVSAVAEICTW